MSKFQFLQIENGLRQCKSRIGNDISNDFLSFEEPAVHLISDPHLSRFVTTIYQCVLLVLPQVFQQFFLIN